MNQISIIDEATGFYYLVSLGNGMEKADYSLILQSLQEELASDSEIPVLLLERLVSLAIEKQFDTDRMVLVSDIKNILNNFGYRLN